MIDGWWVSWCFSIFFRIWWILMVSSFFGWVFLPNSFEGKQQGWGLCLQCTGMIPQGMQGKASFYALQSRMRMMMMTMMMMIIIIVIIVIIITIIIIIYYYYLLLLLLIISTTMSIMIATQFLLCFGSHGHRAWRRVFPLWRKKRKNAWGLSPFWSVEPLKMPLWVLTGIWGFIGQFLQ